MGFRDSFDSFLKKESGDRRRRCQLAVDTHQVYKGREISLGQTRSGRYVFSNVFLIESDDGIFFVGFWGELFVLVQSVGYCVAGLFEVDGADFLG